MKDKEMRKAYDKAIRQWVKADSALQVFASHIIFKGFDDFLPTIGYVSEGCISVAYDYSEIDAEVAIEIMETKGCITPDDFIPCR